MQFAKAADAENGPNVRDAKSHLQIGKPSLAAQAVARRALGDIGNLVGGFHQKVNVGKDAAPVDPKAPLSGQVRPGVLTRRAAAQLAAVGPTVDGSNALTNSTDSWGAKPRNSLRPRDATLGAAAPAGTEPRSNPGRSMSQLLQDRSAAAGAKPARPSAPQDVDAASASDPLAVADYAKDIFSYYQGVEPQFMVASDYMSKQNDVNDRMRAILIDWLVDVHLKFKLMPETLYLTVNLIDRFLEAKQVTRKHLQLVGVTAMLIASKYEEIWAPEVRDFVYISDRAYSREQILQMEKVMLNTLRFNLTVPTAHQFLSRYLKIVDAASDTELVNYATYLVELALPNYAALKHPGSVTACAALYAAKAALNRGPGLPPALARHAKLTEAEVRPCAAMLAALHAGASAASLSAVYKKFSSEKLGQVAKLASPSSLLEGASA
ncbi:G2/mitotic-specific cyclin-1 [Auxenochlorella protothecoides]|uniref:G2/mitotic-specific cyclin-1 n=2 Tax=Auxenochlorella protothecoides TaxID=3075 RepID=A0A087SU71_AUXPR|nr:G2/mitotic-specific cyclin-1 [Auxenochlorella protothecoides]KFM29275.1 G2/mitotic-specific cyclin-1 [Auxenochlorella protothecoides]RMZ56127.1 hypothetical protein APUTEX25_004551 [Auxenochlorella protothecoides]|eukprot:RMZ56127.1 hypothetical protein APUTEX25_004551 [Auxenochlorella protothecoides]